MSRTAPELVPSVSPGAVEGVPPRPPAPPTAVLAAPEPGDSAAGRSTRLAVLTVALTAILPDPDNARKVYPEADLRGLADSLRTRGQLVPVIGIRTLDAWVLLDGHRRWKAAQMAGLTELRLVEFLGDPTPLNVLMTQLSVNEHHRRHLPVEIAAACHKFCKQTGRSAADFAQALNISPSRLSQYRTIASCICPEARAMLDAGEAGVYETYLACSKERDPARQVALLRQLANKEISRRAYADRYCDQPPNRAVPEVWVSAGLGRPAGWDELSKGFQGWSGGVQARLQAAVKGGWPFTPALVRYVLVGGDKPAAN